MLLWYFLLSFSNLTFTEDITCKQEVQQQSDSLLFIEKVYIHTDRDIYYPGEDIWFKAYLIDGVFNSLTAHSTNLHVELVSDENIIVQSRILRMNNGLGNGDFHLAENLGSGTYYLRAYTNYMRNFYDELFFNRKIVIINLSDGGNPFSGRSSEDSLSALLLFFPEGGSLLDNTQSLVAVKTTDTYGFGLNTTGIIISSDGETVTAFSTTHRGMGSFSFTPQPGIKYYAILNSMSGSVLRYELPESFSKGITLGLEKNKQGELVLIFRTNPETFSEIKDHEYFLSLSQLCSILIPLLSHQIFHHGFFWNQMFMET